MTDAAAGTAAGVLGGLLAPYLFFLNYSKDITSVASSSAYTLVSMKKNALRKHLKMLSQARWICTRQALGAIIVGGVASYLVVVDVIPTLSLTSSISIGRLALTALTIVWVGLALWRFTVAVMAVRLYSEVRRAADG